jgi:hypothetical protein
MRGSTRARSGHEYQKRRLPQPHLLQFLHPQDRDRLLDPTIVDRLISAEMPQPVSDPDGWLTEVVRKMMVHGPCGVCNPCAPCMVSSGPARPPTCSKRFPKAFCETTIVKEDGYPEYRRCDFLQTFTVGSALLDNRWIVPHNPYLSCKYNAHINVEVCSASFSTLTPDSLILSQRSNISRNHFCTLVFSSSSSTLKPEATPKLCQTFHFRFVIASAVQIASAHS